LFLVEVSYKSSILAPGFASVQKIEVLMSFDVGSGHVVAVCRRESPRCEKCAGGHETKECVVSVEKVVGVPAGLEIGGVW
jgi:hypothetical protein